MRLEEEKRIDDEWRDIEACSPIGNNPSGSGEASFGGPPSTDPTNNRLPPPPPPPRRVSWTNPKVHEVLKQRPNCRQWMKGFCNFGDRCRYQHPAPPETEGESAGAQMITECEELSEATSERIVAGEVLVQMPGLSTMWRPVPFGNLDVQMSNNSKIGLNFKHAKKRQH